MINSLIDCNGIVLERQEHKLSLRRLKLNNIINESRCKSNKHKHFNKLSEMNNKLNDLYDNTIQINYLSQYKEDNLLLLNNLLDSVSNTINSIEIEKSDILFDIDTFFLIVLKFNIRTVYESTLFKLIFNILSKIDYVTEEKNIYSFFITIFNKFSQENLSINPEMTRLFTLNYYDSSFTYVSLNILLNLLEKNKNNSKIIAYLEQNSISNFVIITLKQSIFSKYYNNVDESIILLIIHLLSSYLLGNIKIFEALVLNDIIEIFDNLKSLCSDKIYIKIERIIEDFREYSIF